MGLIEIPVFYGIEGIIGYAFSTKLSLICILSQKFRLSFDKYSRINLCGISFANVQKIKEYDDLME